MTLAEAVRYLNLRQRKAGMRPRRTRGAARLPALILMTDAARLPDPTAALLRLPRGSAVVLRHYEWPAAKRQALARRLRHVTRRRHIVLLVAGDARLAAAVGADGVHLPEGLLQRRGARAVRLKPGWLVTAAAHSAIALRRADRAGADAALLSPVFTTASHVGAPGLGSLRFAALCRTAGLPVYALGGITAVTARRLTGSGAAGVAGIGFAFGGPPAIDRAQPKV